MALITCPECDNRVSDQTVACPQCGYPVSRNRNVEYEFVTVSNYVGYPGYDGKDEYEALLKDGWKVVNESMEYVKNDYGDVIAVRRHYKLQR